MGWMVSRRSLVLGGLAASAVIVAGGAGKLGLPAPGFRVLSPREVDLVEAIARAMFPPGQFAATGGDGGTAPLVDSILADTIDPLAVEPFRYLLRAMDIGTWFSRGRSFTDLPTDEAHDVLTVWSSDEPFPRRLASDSFKVILGMAFFRRPDVLASVGWRLGCGG